MSVGDSFAQLCFNIGHLLFGKLEDGYPAHEVLICANEMTGVEAAARLYGNYENHFISNYAACLHMKISRERLSRNLAPGLVESHKKLNEGSTNEQEAPSPVHVQLDVFDHGEKGQLDEKDKVRINYRDAYGNLQRQTKIFTVQEFLSSDLLARAPIDRLNLFRFDGAISGPKGLPGKPVGENQFLTSVRWFTTAPAQEEMPIAQGLTEAVVSTMPK